MAQLVGVLSEALVWEAIGAARRQRCPTAWRPGPALAGDSARRESPTGTPPPPLTAAAEATALRGTSFRPPQTPIKATIR